MNECAGYGPLGVAVALEAMYGRWCWLGWHLSRERFDDPPPRATWLALAETRRMVPTYGIALTEGRGQ